MTRILASLGGGAFVLVSVAVGVRLLLLWRRTRGLPELTVGLALLLMGGIGYPLITTARMAQRMPDDARVFVLVVAQIAMVVGTSALAVFTRRVFRPHEPWALAVEVAVAAGIVVCFLAQSVQPGTLAFAQEGFGAWRWNAAFSGLALGWASLESLRYHRSLRRRLRLGLADPVVTDRFRLWGIATAAATLVTVVTLVGKLLGFDVVTRPAGALVIASGGLAASGAMWLAFFAPDRYLARVRAAAAADAQQG